MDEQIKNIIASFIKMPASQINSQTVIGRPAVASSIILHRMYAQLASNGFVVKDYSQINTVAQLFAGLHSKEPALMAPPVASIDDANDNPNQAGIGIDMENISMLPRANDFREEPFYTMNFASAEIAYCILQTNAYASFAGLFAAKEAIIKADNTYKNAPFNSIIIQHLPKGKPIFPGFQLSISHTNEMAIAVAVKNNASNPAPTPLVTTNGKPSLATFFSLTAFLLSLILVLLYIFGN